MNAVVPIHPSPATERQPPATLSLATCLAKAAGAGAPATRVVKVPGVVPASRLEVRPAPALASTGVAAVDALSGGLPRGALTEVFGPASSGRTSLLVSALAARTARGEVCALVDVGDSFAPAPAEAAGVNLQRLLWIRCGTAVSSRQSVTDSKRTATGNWQLATGNFTRLEQALQATDLLLQSGGFGLVAVDMGDIPAPAARRVPLTSWFRFRRAVENTATVLLVVGRESCAKTCASLAIQLSAVNYQPSGSRQSPVASCQKEIPSHAALLTGISVRAEVIRSRLERKPVCAATAEFATRAEWA